MQQHSESTIDHSPEAESGHQAGEIERTLRLSIRDGQAWGVMNGAGTSYVSAFAVQLGGTAFQLSMLASIPELLASLSQLFTVPLVRLIGSRKTLAALMSLLQATTWLGAIALAVWDGPVWLLIIITSFFFVFGMLPAPAWSSLIGDLVPPDVRGRYFGKRNGAVGLTSFGAMVGAGIVLELFSDTRPDLGFVLIFLAAFVARVLSVVMLNRHYDPGLDVRNPEGENFLRFLQRVHRTDFGRLTRFHAAFHVAVFLIGPLFVIYFLTWLGFDYLQYTILISVAAIANFLTMRYWGRHADLFGNRVILVISSWTLALIPFLWYGVWFLPASTQFPAAILAQAVGGLAWAGFNLSASNFQFDSVLPEHRVRLFGHFHLLHGLAKALGALIGGWLVGLIALGPEVLSGLFVVMLLSGALRVVICLVLLPPLKEQRRVRKRPNYIYFLTLMPVEGLHADVAYGFTLTREELRKGLRLVQKTIDWSWLGRAHKKKTAG
jgi:MFS family permease